jgi:hypothetical protein
MVYSFSEPVDRNMCFTSKKRRETEKTKTEKRKLKQQLENQ